MGYAWTEWFFLNRAGFLLPGSDLPVRAAHVHLCESSLDSSHCLPPSARFLRSQITAVWLPLWVFHSFLQLSTAFHPRSHNISARHQTKPTSLGFRTRHLGRDALLSFLRPRPFHEHCRVQIAPPIVPALICSALLAVKISRVDIFVAN